MKVIFHPKYVEHEQPGRHPERPQRLNAILSRWEERDDMPEIEVPEPIKRKDLLSVHSEDYVEEVLEGPSDYLDGGDTYLGENTPEIASLSAGGAVRALELADEGIKTMALLRPPGHHAGRNYGGGFCYLNNIAIAARISSYDRVAIVDIDAHHGNGTSDIFYMDPSALYVSAHHHGIFPGTGEKEAMGEEDGEGYNVNIPFRTGAGDTSVDYAWDEVISPVIEQYDPGLILVSLGTDGHYKDMMTGLSYSSSCYIDTANKVMGLSDKVCDGRISFMLEGGYHLGSLTEIITSIVDSDDIEKGPPQLEYNKVVDDDIKEKSTVDDVRMLLDDHWDLC